MNFNLLKTQFKTITQNVKGKIWFATDSQFQVRKKVFNQSIDNTPFVIVEAHCENDICLVIQFANIHNLPISVKGGGHSNTGSCIVENGIVIDMSAFKSIDISSDHRTVLVGAGVKNMELDAFTARLGLAVPLGTCHDVGVIGATLGGGLGFLSRKYGLTCDSLIRVKMIDTNGKKLVIDKHNKPDLLWALRGGGGCQFGVITEIELVLYKISHTVFGGIIEWPISETKNVLKNYSNQVLSSSRDEFLYAYISRSKQDQAKISIMGFSSAPRAECESFFARVANWGNNANSEMSEKTYLQMQSNLYESGLSVYWRNGFISGGLSPDFIEDVIDCMTDCPDYCGGIMFDPLGGAVQDSSNDKSAFIHRKSSFICSVTGVCEGSNMQFSIKNWVDKSHNTLSSYYNDRAYQNYEYLDQNELTMYFGEHSNRLLALKKKYDPLCRFYGSLSRYILKK